jgi:hypothetical protein
MLDFGVTSVLLFLFGVYTLHYLFLVILSQVVVVVWYRNYLEKGGLILLFVKFMPGSLRSTFLLIFPSTFK